MVQVDIDDDSIIRFIVWHYRYDTETKHFRRIPIAAFSSSREARKLFKAEAELLRKRKVSGHADEREYISLDQKSQGHKGRAQDLRTFLRKIRQE